MAYIIAWIAVIIFAIFVVSLIYTMCKFIKPLLTTIKKTNKMIDSTTKTINSTNNLIKDARADNKAVYPALKGIADTGKTVSDLNDNINKSITKHKQSKNKLKKFITRQFVIQFLKKIFSHHKK